MIVVFMTDTGFKNSSANRLSPYAWYLFLFCAFYLAVAALNDGFMALDEYWVGITRYIPAQASSIMSLVREDDVKSPLQMLPMLAVSKAALGLGVESPYIQYRLVIFILALVSVLVYLKSFVELLKLDFSSLSKDSQFVPSSHLFHLDDSAKKFLLVVMTFYFGGSFALTRPMYESLAAPWLFYSAVKAFKYDLCPNRKDLLWGVFLASVSFCLRPQLGFCALIFVVLPFFKKRPLDLIPVALLGVLFLVLSGLPDLWIRGRWHHSLLQLTVYNYEHGSDYGNKPVTFYPLMFFALSLGPLLIVKPVWSVLKNHFRSFRVFWIYVGLFTFLHSLFPQKWERFMISMIPFIWICTWPLLWKFQKKWREHKVRLGFLYGINFFVLIVASFFPAQKNLINFSLYLDQHKEVMNVLRVDETPGWITEVFIRDRKVQFVEFTADHVLDMNSIRCDSVLVLGKPQLNEMKADARATNFFSRLQLQDQFPVNLIEQLSYKLNPKHNRRRVELFVYKSTDCKL